MLLSLSAASMAGMAVRLRIHAGAQTDAAIARVLARSGIEYTSARLFQDSSRPDIASESNQPDDWAFRDPAGTPLEKARNPSYARTEPYQDFAGDDRYDEGADPYTDLNGNARFDAWSGRLRGRHGIAGTVFALKVSGGNADGGIDVNSGYLGDPQNMDVNRNGVPDCRDLGEMPSPVPDSGTGFLPPFAKDFLLQAQDQVQEMGAGIQWNPKDLFARNRRLAFAVNQLGLMLGVAAPRPGSRIVSHRPFGGYRSLDELSGLFPPADWARLRRGLSVGGRRNPCAPWYFHSYAGPFICGGALQGPDRQSLVNARAAELETVAALFSGMKPYVASTPANALSPLEGLNAARFLQGRTFASRLDLLKKLLADADRLFTPSSGQMVSDTPASKAGWVSALSQPEETGYISSPFQSWSSYDLPGTAGHAYRYRKIELFDSENSSAGGAASLDLGPIASFSIESAGKAGPTGARGPALARAAGIFRAVSHAQGWSQYEFENPGERVLFPGGFVSGRPARNRATTYPGFSRDACSPNLARDELVAMAPYAAYWAGGPFLNTVALSAPMMVAHDYRYCPFYGEVMLLDRSWMEPDPKNRPIFYQPNWDLDQPGRPASGGIPDTFANFDDAAGKAKWARLQTTGVDDPKRGPLQGVDLKGEILRTGAVDPYGDGNPLVTPLGYGAGSGMTQPFLFRWNAGGTAENAAPAPLVDGNGEVSRGTIEEWQIPLSGWDGFSLFFGGGTDYNGNDTSRLDGSWWKWTQTDGSGQTVDQWTNPSSIGGKPWSHAAFVFDAAWADVYIDGLKQIRLKFEAFPVDPASTQKLLNAHADELKIYGVPIEASRILVHAALGRYWTADPSAGPRPDGRDLADVPGFVSPLHVLNAPAFLADVAWDGFVPNVIRDAVDAWNKTDPENPKIPLQVELIVRHQGAVSVVPLPADSWRTGGARADFNDLWKSAHPHVPAPKAEALQYRVRLDASALDPALETPVFDGIEIGFRAGRVEALREE